MRARDSKPKTKDSAKPYQSQSYVWPARDTRSLGTVERIIASITTNYGSFGQQELQKPDIRHQTKDIMPKSTVGTHVEVDY